MAKPAGAAPKTSSGSVYMLTLKAATAKMLSEIPADAQAGEGAQGIASVQQEEQARGRRQTRKRAAGAAMSARDEAQGEPAAGEASDRGEDRRNPDVPDGLLRASDGGRTPGRAWSS